MNVYKLQQTVLGMKNGKPSYNNDKIHLIKPDFHPKLCDG